MCRHRNDGTVNEVAEAGNYNRTEGPYAPDQQRDWMSPAMPRCRVATARARWPPFPDALLLRLAWQLQDHGVLLSTPDGQSRFHNHDDVMGMLYTD